MRGMQSVDPFAVSEGEYRSPLSGSWQIERMGQEGEVVYCEMPEDIHMLQAMLNRGYRQTMFVKEDSPVFLLSRKGDTTGTCIGTVAKVKEDTGRRRMPQWPAIEGEISDVVDYIAADIGDIEEPELVVEEDDIVARLETNTSVRQVKRFQECAIYENKFNHRKELGLSVDYFKKKQGDDGSFTTDFRYRNRKKEGVAGSWVSKSYVEDAVRALDEYDILKDVCLDSSHDASSAKEVSRQWDDTIKSINGMRKISDRYFTQEARDEFRDFTQRVLEKKALELAGYAKQDGIDHQSAVQAFAWLVKSNHPKRLNRALELAENYVQSAVEITKTRIRDVVNANDEKYGSPYPPKEVTIQTDIRGRFGSSRPSADFEVTRKVGQGQLFKNAGYRKASSDDATRNVRLHASANRRPAGSAVDKVKDNPDAKDMYDRLLSSGRSSDVERAIGIAQKYLSRDAVQGAVNMWKESTRNERLSAASSRWEAGDVLEYGGTNGVYNTVRAEETASLRPLRMPDILPKKKLESRVVPPPIGMEERRASGLPPLDSRNHSESGVRVRQDADLQWIDSELLEEIHDTPPPIPHIPYNSAAGKRRSDSTIPPPPPSILNAPRVLPSVKTRDDRRYLGAVDAA